MSDPDDDLPLASLKRRHVSDQELEEEDDGDHRHLDCFDSSCSERDQDLIGKEPILPRTGDGGILQRSLTDQFPADTPLKDNLPNQPVVEADLSARALAHAHTVT